MQEQGSILKPRLRYTSEGYFIVTSVIGYEGLIFLVGPHSTIEMAYNFAKYWIGI